MRIASTILVSSLLLAAAPASAAEQDLDGLRNGASAILEQHCSRCHQMGKLVNLTRAEKDFGNILDLPALVQERRRIMPGQHDNSKIWQLMFNKKMPYDAYTLDDPSKPAAKEPNAAEIQTIADWIDAEGKAQQAAAAVRVFVRDGEVIKAIADDLGTLRSDRAATSRYLTLTHLYNGGASDEAIEVYRQGAVKLLNSLTFEHDPIKYEKLGPKDTILRFNLKDMGWTDEQWNLLLAANPFGVRPQVKPDDQLFDLVAHTTGTPLAYVRADWFVFAGAQPPLYDKLLKLPDSIDEIERDLLHVDRNADIADYKAQRAGFQKSGVSRNNRLIERHPMQWGAYWASYDFGSNEGVKSLFLHPLGPNGPDAFQHDGGEFIFSLPNGMQAYRLSTSKGVKLDRGPQNIVLDPSRRDNAVTNGISCMGCHVVGMRDDGKDELRKLVEGDHNFSVATREAVMALHPVQAEMDKLIAADKARFLNAMSAAGLQPLVVKDGKLVVNVFGGKEMINALFLNFENNLTKAAAAAELGLTPQQLDEAAGQVGGEAHELLRRLANDQVPRDQFDRLFAELSAKLTDNRPLDGNYVPTATAVNTAVAPPLVGDISNSYDFDLALFADKSGYKAGEYVTLTVKPSKDCFLTLFSVDLKGTVSLLVPNKFLPAAPRISAGQAFQFPRASDGFDFTLNDPGREKVTAVCSISEQGLPGAEYDSSKGDFSTLGDEAALNEKIAKTREIKVRETLAQQKSGVKIEPPSGSAEARRAIVLEVH